MFRTLSNSVRFTLLFCILVQPCFAQKQYCQPVSVSGESIVLGSKKPAFFLIRNVSESDVWLSHPAIEPHGDMSTRIASHQSAALILKQTDFNMQCIESKPGHEQQLPCASLVTVCQAEKINIPSAEQNTHFLRDNVRRTLALWRVPAKKNA